MSLGNSTRTSVQRKLYTIASNVIWIEQETDGATNMTCHQVVDLVVEVI